MVGSTPLADVTVQTNEGNKIVEYISKKHFMIIGLVIGNQIKPWHNQFTTYMHTVTLWNIDGQNVHRIIWKNTSLEKESTQCVQHIVYLHQIYDPQSKTFDRSIGT